MMANKQALARSNLSVMAQFHGWARFGYRSGIMRIHAGFASLAKLGCSMAKLTDAHHVVSIPVTSRMGQCCADVCHVRADIVGARVREGGVSRIPELVICL
jgi:hypothetical protein